MRAPVAEKLAELRAKCDRIIQAPDKRKSMTYARKRRLWEAAHGACMHCQEPVPMTGPQVRYDHIVALELGGSDDDANIAPIHRHPCDEIKTANDLRAIGKVRRLRARDDGSRRERKRIPGKPLSDRSLTRGFNGKVRPRPETSASEESQ